MWIVAPGMRPSVSEIPACYEVDGLFSAGVPSGNKPNSPRPEQPTTFTAVVYVRKDKN